MDILSSKIGFFLVKNAKKTLKFVKMTIPKNT